MRVSSAGAVQACPNHHEKAGRRKRLPENHSTERRRENRSRGSLKRYPSHWSDEQKRARADLRKWERLSRIQEKEKFPVRLLCNQLAEGRLQPYMLPSYYALGPLMAIILGCVSKCCLLQRSKAVSGSRAWWGRLLGCGGTKAHELLKSACNQGFLERLPQFKPHRGYGRDGEHIDNRQIDTCYRPGVRLRSLWLAYHNELANRSKRRTERFRSTADGIRQPSLRSKSLTSSSQTTVTGSSSAPVDKVPPAAASIDSPPMAAQAHRRPVIEHISVGDPKLQGAIGILQLAADGSKDKSASRADSSRPHAGRPQLTPVTDEEKQRLDAGSVDTAHARALWRLARPDDIPRWVPRDDREGREMALTLAGVLAKLKASSDPDDGGGTSETGSHLSTTR